MANPWSDRDDKARLSPNYQVLTMSNKAIFKILVGVAWIDGQVQPEERQHLQELAHRQGLDQDEELRPYLTGEQAVAAEDCYRWIGDYLGTKASDDRVKDDRANRLLEAVSGLIYSDGDVETAEAALLQSLLPPLDASAGQISPSEAVLNRIRSLYRHWLSKLD
jgi:uncharacterized tellurite resistance protein B-like protein